jgi:hypothetical protein
MGDAPRMGTLSQGKVSCITIEVNFENGSDPNVAHDTLSQYGDYFCEIVVKSDFK